MMSKKLAASFLLATGVLAQHDISGWAYTGCTEVDPSCFGAVVSDSPSTLNPEDCENSCESSGYSVAAVFSDHCRCGNDVPFVSVPESNCDNPCGGDANNGFCGSAGSNSTANLYSCTESGGVQSTTPTPPWASPSPAITSSEETSPGTGGAVPTQPTFVPPAQSSSASPPVNPPTTPSGTPAPGNGQGSATASTLCPQESPPAQATQGSGGSSSSSSGSNSSNTYGGGSGDGCSSSTQGDGNGSSDSPDNGPGSGSGYGSGNESGSGAGNGGSGSGTGSSSTGNGAGGNGSGNTNGGNGGAGGGAARSSTSANTSTRVNGTKGPSEGISVTAAGKVQPATATAAGSHAQSGAVAILIPVMAAFIL